MEEYVDIEGSRTKIVEDIMDACSLDKEIVELSLDFIKSNQEILPDKEFFNIVNQKSTIFLAVLYVETKIPGFAMAKEMIII